MRRCRKLISMIVMMAMLATMTPYQALAAEPPSDAAAQEIQTVAEEEGQEQEQDTQETIQEEQKESDEGQKDLEEGGESTPSENPSEVTPGSDEVDSISTDNGSTEDVVEEAGSENSGEGKSVQPEQEIADPDTTTDPDTTFFDANGQEIEPADEPADEPEQPELVYREVSDDAGLVTVSGMLPADVTVTARKLTAAELAALEEQGLHFVFAYDITLWYLGKEYQPEGSVTVVFNDVELPDEDFAIQHVTTDKDGTVTSVQEVSHSVSDDTLSIVTDGFSLFGLVTSRGTGSVPTYTYSVQWVNGTSGTGWAEDYHYTDAAAQTNLVYHPLKNEVMTALLKINIVIQGDGSAALPAGSVSFTVPNNIFTNWGGGTDVNIDTETQLKWQLPQAPNQASTSDFNYVDNGDGTYTATNFNALSGGNTFSVQISYQFLPSYVPGGTLTSGTFGAADAVYGGDYFQKTIPVSLSFDTNVDGSPEETATTNLNVEVHTRVTPLQNSQKLAATADSQGGAFFSWQSSWGNKPADADDYFYMVWFIQSNRSTTDTTQPYTVSLLEDATTLGGYQGEVIGAYWEKNTAGTNYSNPIPGTYPGIYKTGAALDAELNDRYVMFARGYCTWDQYGSQPGNYEFKARASAAANYSDPKFCWAILTRYPLTLVDEAEASGVDLVRDGLTITNKAVIRQESPNGEVIETQVEGQNTIYKHTYTGGSSISKSHDNNYVIRGALSFLPQGMPVQLNDYVIKFSGSSIEEPTWDSATGTYSMTPYEIVMTDGDMVYSTVTNTNLSNRSDITTAQAGDSEIVSFYLSAKGYDAQKNGGVWTVSDTVSTDYHRLEKIDVEYDFGSGYVHTGVITVEDDGSLNYASDDGAVAVTGISSSNRVPAPEGAWHLRLTPRSTYFKTDLTVNILIKVLASDMVKALAQKAVDEERFLAFTNDAHSSLRQQGHTSIDRKSSDWETTAALTYVMTAVNHSIEAGKTHWGVSDYPAEAYQSVGYFISFTSRVQIPAEYATEEYLAKYCPTKGTFYDLLPPGITRVRNIRSDRTGSAATIDSYEYVDDWENTGRTMLIIHVSRSYSSPTVDGAGNRAFSIGVDYTMDNTYVNIQDYGTTSRNTVAYVDESENLILKPASISSYNNLGPVEQDAYADLQNDKFPYIYYRTGTTSFNPVTVLQAGFTKRVATASNASYASENAAVLGDSLTYRLRYMTDSSTYADSIVFYDVFSDVTNTHTGNSSSWTPIFKSVDVSSPAGKVNAADDTATCAPVIYYATVKPTSAQLDVSNSIWSTAKPADVSSIKAIAVDCRTDTKGNPFVMDMAGSMSLFVHMTAPNDPSLVNTYSSNEGVVSAGKTYSPTSPSGAVESMNDFSQVKLVAPELELHKVSNPVTGTAADPALFENGTRSLNYTLTVKNTNSDDLAYFNVVLEDPIPAGLTIDTANVKLTIKNASNSNVVNNQLISGRSEAVLAVSGQKLTFTIHSFAPGYTYSFSIPTVREGEVLQTTDYINTARIINVNNLTTDIPSETTYHRTPVTKLKVTKIWDDNNDQDGKRASVGATVQLYKKVGTAAGTPVNASEFVSVPTSDGDIKTWENLPVYENGTAITYYIVETLPAGTEYTKDGDGESNGITATEVDDLGTITVKNSYTPETVERVIIKTWADNDDAFGIRPASLQVKLTGTVEGTTYSVEYPITLTGTAGTRPTGTEPASYESAAWTATFINLPKKHDGALITYTASEPTVPTGYTMTMSDPDANGTITITNTPETVEIEVKKVWASPVLFQPDSVTVQLYKTVGSGDKTQVGEAVELKASNTPVAWGYTWTDLAKYGKDNAGDVKTITYTVEEDPVPTSYTVAYDPAAGYTGVSGTITVTNTPVTGDLELSKVLVSDLASDKDVMFTFRVELSKLDNKAISGTYGDMTFTDGVATVELKGGETATATGLPTTVTYTITEANATGFQLTGQTGDTGTITTKPSTATFTNTREKGNLKVTKTVVSSTAADENVKFTFTVTLGDTTINGVYGDMTFTDGVATFTLKHGESKTATGLPTTVTYEVVETANDAFVTTSTGETGSITTSGATAAFTNTKKEGGLIVSKKVVSALPADKEATYTITITLSDTSLNETYTGKIVDKEVDVKFVKGVATVELKDAEAFTIKGLPAGLKATISEEAPDGLQATYDPANGEVTIPDGDTSTATVAVTNTRDTGDLELSKVLVSDLAADADVEFEFTVTLDPAISGTYGDMTFTDGVATLKLKGGESATAKGLPTTLKYEITEAEAEGFELTGKTGDTGTISTTPSEAEFTNTRKTGNLSVTKEVINKNDTNTAKEFEITVTLDNDTIEGEFGEEGTSMTFVKGVATFTLKDGETKTATGLPSGIGYTVVETADDGFVTSYENVTEEAGDAGDGTDGQTDGEPAEGDEEETGDETEGISGTIVVDETKSVKVINTYLTEGEYAVEVKKVLEGRLLKEGQFEFELSDREGEVLQTVKNDLDGNVKFEPIAYTVEDLDKETEGERAGYIKDETFFTYSVKEVIPEGAEDNGDGTFTLDGYIYDAKEQTVTVSLKDNGDGTITAEADKKLEDLTFTNIYAADGEVFIGGVKVLEGQDLKAGQFKFVLSDESGKKVLEATNDANGNFEFEGIKYELADLDGETEKVFSYGVTEINDGQSNITYDKTAYTVKVTVTDNGDGTLTAKADKSRGEIKFTNKYTPPETPKEDKPKHKKSNNTGDSANGALWALILLLAGGALAGTIWFRRRKKV